MLDLYTYSTRYKRLKIGSIKLGPVSSKQYSVPSKFIKNEKNDSDCCDEIVSPCVWLVAWLVVV